ncbi:MAG: response regulator [Candidatus Aenigmarchaeota archaeon]|nr:response regulator [Candidatus Aenigmarchaeota archaeon]
MTTKKILLIEDDLTLAEMYEMKLVMSGFLVRRSYTGKEALKAIEKECPDLILLDILMPEMDGFGLLKELKRAKNNTPVIILTNLGEAKADANLELAKSLGVKDYLIKSKHTPEDIVRKAELVLQGKNW